MLRKLWSLLFSISLAVTMPGVVKAAEKPVQLYVNHDKLVGVHTVMKKGLLYVQAQEFFTKLGYKVSYDPELKEFITEVNGHELSFWATDDTIEFNGRIYYMDTPVFVMDDKPFIYVRLLGYIMEHSVDYDPAKQSVSMNPYGDGQMEAIRELVWKYDKTFSPDLLTSDNLERGYYSSDYDYQSYQLYGEVPLREYTATIDHSEFTSATEAALRVTYVENTDVLNRLHKYNLEIRWEDGMWKVARSEVTLNQWELPSDIDAKAAVIKKNFDKEQAEVLSDLASYFKAYNAEDLELTRQYTSPAEIQTWGEGDFSWENMLSSGFDFSDTTYQLSDERVVFLGEREAVVQATMEWSEVREGEDKEQSIFPALIFMDYTNNHWSYSYYMHLDDNSGNN
ncbi:hypothetical protein D3C74_17090 [compost metagenome]